MTDIPTTLTYESDTIFTPDFFNPTKEADDKVIEKFGLPLDDICDCPVCLVEGPMVSIIAHLNNTEGNTSNTFDMDHGCHGWTFKQIGEWLKEKGY